MTKPTMSDFRKIRVIHGPNLNFLGIREKDIYGQLSFAKLNELILNASLNLKFETQCFQSNSEGEIIDYLQSCYQEKADGIIINPGAFTHYSYAIYDAVASINIPTIEVHISNIHKREQFRHKSVIAPACIGQIAGFGFASYELALVAMKNYLDLKSTNKGDSSL